MKKAAIMTLGCKVNSYESERIREDMVKAGFEITDFNEPADVYIINTCSVTNIADRKSRQMLHKASQQNKNAVIVATGCYVQASPDDEKLLETADIIVGNNHKGSIAKLILKYLENKENENTSCYVENISEESKVEDMSIDDYPERSRAFLRIQDGCNQFCTYCIIPFTRGRVRSRDKDEIINEVKVLAQKGFKEIVITGIHISSYGIDNYEKNARNDEWDGRALAELITEINAVEGIERIRLGSLEPRIITEGFTESLLKCQKVCPHFHLSLQSGCDSVLKRMNRHYSAEDFLYRCELLRKSFDRPAITTDIIVGFPGETDLEFGITCDFVEKANFSKMHIFKFSRRSGTVADKMQGQLTDRVKHERSLVLQEKDEKMHRGYAELFVGEKVNVLVETEDDVRLSGLTERYLEVMIPKSTSKDLIFPEGNVNRIFRVLITGLTEDNKLIGKVCV